MKKILIVLVSLVILTSCGENSIFSGKISEGVVEYDIQYHDDERDNPLISLLPTTMSFKFKKNNSIQKIEGWMGIFSMAGIHMSDQGKNIALLKIMNEKYVYEASKDDKPFGFDEMPEMNIEYTNETKEIAGYPCKKAIITLQDSAHTTFDIFYFDKIKLENPNCHNPFGQIPGFLMEYQMSFQDIGMTLTATKVEETEIENTDFDVPDGYELVERDKIQEVIDNLM